MIRKRSITLDGHRTSIALEAEFWDGLAVVAATRGLSVPKLVAGIDRDRGEAALASAIRVAVLAHFRAAPGNTHGGDR